MMKTRFAAASLLSLAVVVPAAATGAASAAPAAAAARVTSTDRPAPTATLGLAVAMTPPQLAQQRQTAVHATVAPALTDRKAAANSTNWSGLLTSGSFQGIAGQWTVPSVQVTATNRYSCTWIGLDGWNGSATLIQTGTEEDSYNGATRDYAWIEMLPKYQQVITYTSNGQPVPVAAGDTMWSYIYRTTGNTWAIYLQDTTKGWSLSTTTPYATPGGTVEWVHEATQVGGVVTAPPAFSPVNWTSLEVLENGTWYYTGMDARSKVFLVRNGHTYATPSTPTATSPQRFSITSS